jgi:hypothetical protein
MESIGKWIDTTKATLPNKLKGGTACPVKDINVLGAIFQF